MKFGGTSVLNAERIRNTVRIIVESARKEPTVVVLSAMRGVTDSLIQAANEAQEGDTAFRSTFAEIADRQETAIQGLFESRSSAAEGVRAKLRGLVDELEEILRGVSLIRECSPRTMDLVMSFGERLNCTLAADYLRSLGEPGVFVDARELIATDGTHGRAEVDYSKTAERTRSIFSKIEGIAIVTGFIASSPDGSTTTLGRNGSDFTASILGAALDVRIIEIWTDVDGLLSADPRFVENAFVLPHLSFQEAMELSYFGARVIHPSTMIPAVRANIPILIKNALRPELPGSLISQTASGRTRPITGIASIENVALINVEGSGMIGVRGIASRVFRALADADVNVIMISQASSEHSICLVCRENEAVSAVRSLEDELGPEMASGTVERFQLVKNLEIVAIIGETMRGTPGISGRLFSALGHEGINVLAIAQGSSELNISFVVEKAESRHALTTIHRAFLEETE
jgi:aspartokinase/homoserine dehydrogenase 1